MGGWRGYGGSCAQGRLDGQWCDEWPVSGSEEELLARFGVWVWDGLLRLSVGSTEVRLSGPPRAPRQVSQHQAKWVSVFQLTACVGESPAARTLRGAQPATLVQTRVIDSLAVRAASLMKGLAALTPPWMLCALGLPFSL